MRKIICALPVMLAIAAPTSAKPVFLDCTMHYKTDEPRHWQISFDEEQGTLTWSSDNGHAGKMSAIFTAETVTGIDHVSSDLTRQWTVNRVNGAATDSMTLANLSPVTSEGTCSAVEPPKRKF